MPSFKSLRKLYKSSAEVAEKSISSLKSKKVVGSVKSAAAKGAEVTKNILDTPVFTKGGALAGSALMVGGGIGGGAWLAGKGISKAGQALGLIDTSIGESEPSTKDNENIGGTQDGAGGAGSWDYINNSTNSPSTTSGSGTSGVIDSIGKYILIALVLYLGYKTLTSPSFKGKTKK